MFFESITCPHTHDQFVFWLRNKLLRVPCCCFAPQQQKRREPYGNVKEPFNRGPSLDLCELHFFPQVVQEGRTWNDWPPRSYGLLHWVEEEDRQVEKRKRLVPGLPGGQVACAFGNWPFIPSVQTHIYLFYFEKRHTAQQEIYYRSARRPSFVSLNNKRDIPTATLYTNWQCNNSTFSRSRQENIDRKNHFENASREDGGQGAFQVSFDDVTSRLLLRQSVLIE